MPTDQWYMCQDCKARGLVVELKYQECPICGGQLLPIDPPKPNEYRFVLTGNAYRVFNKLNDILKNINELQQKNNHDTKQLQLEADLPAVYVQCMMAKICDVQNCNHSKPHEPELYDTSTCRHGNECSLFHTRCFSIDIPSPFKP